MVRSQWSLHTCATGLYYLHEENNQEGLSKIAQADGTVGVSLDLFALQQGIWALQDFFLRPGSSTPSCRPRRCSTAVSPYRGKTCYNNSRLSLILADAQVPHTPFASHSLLAC